MLALPHGAARRGRCAVWNLVSDSQPRREHRMARQKWNEMFRHANRPNARSAAAVRNAKRLVQIQMAHVRADEAGRSQADLRVHVRAVHVDLAAVGVDDVANFADGFLEHTVRAGIRHHQAGQIVFVRLGFRLQVGHVNVAVGVARDGDDFHAGHRGAGGIRAVCGSRNQANIPVRLVARFVIGADDEQAGYSPCEPAFGCNEMPAKPVHSASQSSRF